MQEQAHVAGPDPRFLVECLLRRAFGQVVGLFLFHLVVLREFLVYRLDAVFLSSLIGAHDPTSGPAGCLSWLPFAAAADLALPALVSIAFPNSFNNSNIS